MLNHLQPDHLKLNPALDNFRCRLVNLLPVQLVISLHLLDKFRFGPRDLFGLLESFLIKIEHLESKLSR